MLVHISPQHNIWGVGDAGQEKALHAEYIYKTAGGNNQHTVAVFRDQVKPGSMNRLKCRNVQKKLKEQNDIEVPKV